jgi:beta-lactamase regulating signal transducer with metallopeptidase domain
MSATDVLLQDPAAQAIGWALLQFVWQGALIGVFTAAALAALSHSAADIRYVVSTIGLTLMLTMPVVTAVQTWRTDTPARDGAASDLRSSQLSALESRAGIPASREASRAMPGDQRRASTRGTDAVTPAPETLKMTRSDSHRLASWMPLLFTIWLTGVALLTLRLLSGWLWVQRLKSHAAVPAGAGVADMAVRLARRLHINRTVTFLESKIVEVPTVIGWMRPVVLVPASALAGLSPAQLEAILAHELAHIRRHDYLVNLLQTLVETLLFYHPAVWWLSRRIRIEREHCCDDLAVSLCGDPVAYARALADLEALRNSSQFVLAANGGSLVDRVRRLLGAPSHAGRSPGWLAASVSVLVISAIAAGAMSAELGGSDQTAVAAAPSAAAASAAVATTTNVARAAQVAAMTAPTPAVATTQTVAAQRAREIEARAKEIADRAQDFSAVIARHAVEIDNVATALATMPVISEAAVALAEAAQSIDTTPIAAAVSALATAPVVAQSKSRGNFIYSNDGEKLSINYEGAIEFTDDDADVKSLSPGGFLKIKEGGLLSSKTVEFRADASGKIERRFWVGSSERPFEPEGRQWLAQKLPRFIRQSGLGAEARAARILRQKGPDGVLAEIGLIEGSWAKRIYFTELLKSDKLDPQVVERALTQASREIDSDFELASLLIGTADHLLVTDATRKAYFDASRSIDSDFEMRRVYSSALKRGTMSSDAMASLLEASTAIDSDFEAASLLVDVAKLQALDGRTRPPFFKLLNSISSDFERRRALTSMLNQGDVSVETRNAALESAMAIDSDFEKATLLLTFIKPNGIEEAVRPQFFRVADTIDSSFERGRVLQAVVKSGDNSPQTIADVLRSAGSMGSGFETSQVLLAIASKYPLTGEARDLYISAAERLGDFEQSQALAALVKK